MVLEIFDAAPCEVGAFLGGARGKVGLVDNRDLGALAGQRGGDHGTVDARTDDQAILRSGLCPLDA